jgi:hypothetical protein
MGKLKLFNENLEIGGYQLPTDFVCVDTALLDRVKDLDFFSGYKLIFEYLSSTDLPSNAFDNLKDVEFPLSIVSFDENLSAVEMFDGKNAVYTDYLLQTDNLFLKICSGVTVFILTYLDMVNSDLISMGDSVNFACPSSDFMLPLSCYVAKKCGLYIDKIIVGSTSHFDGLLKDIFVTSVDTQNEDDAISIFFEDTDYLFDPISVRGLIAEDEYYSDYEDGNVTVILSLISPYKFSRRIIKSLTGKTEMDVKKAINGVYNQTAIEIPNGILNGEISPFYKEEDNKLDLTLFNLIKKANKV